MSLCVCVCVCPCVSMCVCPCVCVVCVWVPVCVFHAAPPPPIWCVRLWAHGGGHCLWSPQLSVSSPTLLWLHPVFTMTHFLLGASLRPRGPVIACVSQLCAFSVPSVGLVLPPLFFAWQMSAQLVFPGAWQQGFHTKPYSRAWRSCPSTCFREEKHTFKPDLESLSGIWGVN